jgi:hypothetical protein
MESLREIFFSIVDNDESLKTKAQLAYAKGYAWTTVADVRALSAIFAALSWLYFAVVFLGAGFNNGFWAAILFVMLFLLTFPASKILTEKHVSIGNEQLEIIEHHHVADLQKKLGVVSARAAARRA